MRSEHKHSLSTNAANAAVTTALLLRTGMCERTRGRRTRVRGVELSASEGKAASYALQGA